MNSLSEYKGKRIQITSDQAGRVMFFKGVLLDYDNFFVKIDDQKLCETLVAINSIKRIEECE